MSEKDKPAREEAETPDGRTIHCPTCSACRDAIAALRGQAVAAEERASKAETLATAERQTRDEVVRRVVELERRAMELETDRRAAYGHAVDLARSLRNLVEASERNAARKGILHDLRLAIDAAKRCFRLRCTY